MPDTGDQEIQGFFERYASDEPDATCYSPSQIETYVQCPRKWAFTAIEKLPRTDTPSTENGRVIHAMIEGWYANHAPLDFTEEGPKGFTKPGYVAAEILRHLPDRDAATSDEIEVEREFLLLSHGHRYYGLMDLYDGLSLVSR